jgi:hypothetical protein
MRQCNETEHNTNSGIPGEKNDYLGFAEHGSDF